jgi:serine/threonine-protein kinase
MPPADPHDEGAAPVSNPPRQSPDRIGRFVVHGEIGRGSNGVVYAATDPVLGRDVAIKAIPLHGSHGISERLPTFLQEAKTAAGLNHPGIVTVFDAGQTDRLAYIAMERLEGVDLHHWLADRRVMPERNAAALMARVADAVHFAHRRGLIHRDIKPSNIFLNQELKPKVLDFGVAVMVNQQTITNHTGRLIGTPNYMSPEQALGKALDARSDVFSLGCILYELLTGHRAFAGASVDATLAQVVRDTPPSVDHWRPDIDAALVAVVAKSMAKDPEARHQSAAQLRNELAAIAGRPVPPATQSIGFNPATMNALIHRPWRRIAASLGLVALAATLITVGVWLGRHAAPSEATVAAAPAPNPAPAAVDATVTAPKAAAIDLSPQASPSPPPPTARRPVIANPRRPSTDSNSGSTDATAGAGAAASAAPAVTNEPGYLALAVIPWGQVIIDGEAIGVSPPLSRLPLSPGEHAIEVRNGGAPEYMTEVHVVSGQTVFIQHRF